MEIQIKLEKEDWKKFQSHIERELPKRCKTWLDGLWGSLVTWVVIALAFFFIFRQVDTFDWPTAATVGIFFILLTAFFFINVFRIRKAFEPAENGAFCGNHHFRFTDTGIESEGEGYKGFHSWETVKSVERTQGLILIYIDTVYAFIFPESKLSDPDGLFHYISVRFSSVTNSVV